MPGVEKFLNILTLMKWNADKQRKTEDSRKSVSMEILYDCSIILAYLKAFFRLFVIPFLPIVC